MDVGQGGPEVEQVTSTPSYARRTGQEVPYITERAVLRLEPQGLALIESAPGIEIERDILPYMDFEPRVSSVAAMQRPAPPRPARPYQETAFDL